MAKIKIELECHSSDIDEVLRNMREAYENCPAGIQSYGAKIINKDY